MNAKFALVIAEGKRDENGYEDINTWRNLALNIPRTLAQAKKTLMIHDNVWLIPLESELPVLGSFLEQLTGYNKIHVRVLFLAEFPAWLEWPPVAKETPSQTAS
ncbi:MAG: hypothetical protein ACREFE_14090 [Limisphaerales bacterium]